MATTEIWTYREETWAGADLTGFSVEAVDGGIGKIDEVTHDVGASYLVVDTGLWIFGKKVMLPAGVVDRADVDEKTVFVNLTKDEIKDAPELENGGELDDAYRQELGWYFAGLGHGPGLGAGRADDRDL